MTIFKQKGSQFVRVENALIDFGRKGVYSTDDKKVIGKLKELGYESETDNKSEKNIVDIDDLLSRLTELKADELKVLAKHFEVPYTNKEQTMDLIQEKMGLSEDDKKYNELIVKIDELEDEDLSFVSNHLQIEFTTKEETVLKIKEFLGL